MPTLRAFAAATLTLLLALSAHAADPAPQCRADADCVVSTTCRQCNQCVGKASERPGVTDCAAVCQPQTGISCACERNACVPRLATFLMARDGRQCALPRESKQEVAAMHKRLTSSGIRVERLSVAAALGEGLPAACRPADVERFFREHPKARSGVQRSGGQVCEGCGCPETWYFCLESRSPPGAVESLGFARVR